VNILRLAALACLVCLLLVPAGVAQTITGSTTIDIDPDTGYGIAICQTDLDADTATYYQASVTCRVYADGTYIGSRSAVDTRRISGIAMAFFSFAGVPGTTYTAIGIHTANVLYTDDFGNDPATPTYFYDAYDFSSFETPPVETYLDTFDWVGPGPPVDLPSSFISTGQTTATATDPQVPTSLKFISATVLPTGTTNNSGCTPTTDYGIDVDIKYQVLDQAQPPKPILQSGMTPYEALQHADGSFSPASPIGPSVNSNSSATTASDGTFHDVPVGICSAGTFSGANILQIIYINSTSQKVRQNSFTVSSSGAGHGSITNNNDVSKSR
jgi:hypothetical protein